jgi:hypothetical protein
LFPGNANQTTRAPPSNRHQHHHHPHSHHTRPSFINRAPSQSPKKEKQNYDQFFFGLTTYFCFASIAISKLFNFTTSHCLTERDPTTYSRPAQLHPLRRRVTTSPSLAAPITTMSSTSNSWLRNQRKSDLVEIAKKVGLEKYVRAPFRTSSPLLPISSSRRGLRKSRAISALKLLLDARLDVKTSMPPACGACLGV